MRSILLSNCCYSFTTFDETYFLAAQELMALVIARGADVSAGTTARSSPFSLLVGAALVCGYALLGATWLIMKSEGSLLAHCRRLALPLGIAVIVGMGAVSAATPFLANEYYLRWFAWPQVLFTAIVPVLVAVASVVFFVALRRGHHYWPFLIALLLFAGVRALLKGFGIGW